MKRILAGLLLSSVAAWGQMVPITSRGIDNASSGWNSHETQLTQASIRAKGLVRQPPIPLCCDARGMEASPIILPSVQTAKGLRDLLYLPSMSDDLRAVDAHTGEEIWSLHLGTPIKSSSKIDYHLVNSLWGCLSTGVIDPDTSYAYQVCWVSQDGSGTPESGRYMLFVVDLRAGALVTTPIPVQGDDPSVWKQRSSLVMTNVGGVKTIFFAHGSVYENGGGWKGYTGGITAFDVATNTVSAQLPFTSGIWQAGAKLSADADGYLYAITGNGDFDPSKGWYGESFVKVQYVAPSTIWGSAPCDPDTFACLAVAVSKGVRPAKLSVVDAWSPWSDFQRTGQQQVPNAKLAGESAPSEGVKPVGGGMDMPMQNAKLVATMNAQGQPQVLVYPSMAQGLWSDEDWGSAGPACIFAIHVCVASGKDGIGYAIRTTALGGTTAATVGTAANYAKLASPCAWLTMSPGRGIPCDPADPRDLNFFPGGDSAHLHMQPPQFWNPLLKTWEIAVWGENQQLHLWAVSSTGTLKYIAQSNEFASPDVRNRAPGGMVGGECTGSSNGTDPSSYLLFCSVPNADANATITTARLLVYDPLHLASDGSVQKLWDSRDWAWNIVYNKFMPGVIDGGVWFLPNYQGGIERLGQ